MSEIQKVRVENSVSWGGSFGIALGVWWYVWGLYGFWWYVWGLYGFWWGVCYGLFWPVWLGYRLAAYLLAVHP